MILSRLFTIGFFVVGLPGLSSSGKVIPSFAGPFRVLMRRINNDSDEFESSGEVWARIYVTSPKPGRELQYRWGRSFVGMPLDDTFKVDVRMSTWANNQWKRNAFVMKLKDACSTVMSITKTMVYFITGEKNITCPIKPGLRVLRNESFDINFRPTVNVFPYGRWRFNALLSDKHSRGVGIFNAHLDTVPIV